MTETEAILERGNANLAKMGMGAETARGPETLAQGGGIAAHTLTGTQFASVGTPVSTQRPETFAQGGVSARRTTTADTPFGVTKDGDVAASLAEGSVTITTHPGIVTYPALVAVATELRPDDAFRAAQEGKLKRAPAVKGKCGHCGRYWSGHRYNNDRNVAYCYASENSTWFTPEEDMLPPAEQPAQAAGGISEDEYDMIMRLDAERTKARQQAEEDAEVASASGRYFNEAEAEYFNYLGSLKKGGKP